jgi:hypothetical protein
MGEMPTIITYRDVFGADPGEEITGRMTWRGCPAVMSLRAILGAHTYLERKLGGQSGYINEFNRHHAGLAVDIMLSPRDPAQRALGQALFLVFIRFRATMRWRGMIYQHVTCDSLGNATSPLSVGQWETDDHADHIHIDWHSSRNVTWVPCTRIPVRAPGSPTARNITPKQGNRIASAIEWTAQAMTDFRQDTGLIDAVGEVMDNFSSDNLSELSDLRAEAIAARDDAG